MRKKLIATHKEKVQRIKLQISNEFKVSEFELYIRQMRNYSDVLYYDISTYHLDNVQFMLDVIKEYLEECNKKDTPPHQKEYKIRIEKFTSKIQHAILSIKNIPNAFHPTGPYISYAKEQSCLLNNELEKIQREEDSNKRKIHRR